MTKINRDISDLFFCAILLLLFWAGVQEVRPGIFPIQYDGLQFTYAHFNLTNLSSSDSSLTYSPSWLGGSELAGLLNYSLWAKIGFALGMQTINVIIFILVASQWLLGFVSLKLMDGLIKAISPHAAVPEGIERILITALFCFNPIIAWKLPTCHFLEPAMLTLIIAAILVTYKTTIISIVGFLFLFIGLICSFQSVSYQLHFFAIFFSMPFLLMLYCNLPRFSVRELCLLFAIIFSAFAVTLPSHIETILFFTSSDFNRVNISGASLVFSYITQNLSDWLTSIPWNFTAFKANRPLHFLHESNFAFGPVVIILLIGLFTKARGLVLSIIFPILILILFSSAVEPITTILLKLIPPLAKFRVPARGIFTLLLIALPLAIAALKTHNSKIATPSTRIKIIALLAAILLFVIGHYFSPLAAEIFVWLSAILLVSKTAVKFELRLALTAIIVSGAVLSFKVRLPQNINLSQTSSNLIELREKILAAEPELSDPLTRSHFRISDLKFATNTPFLLGFSTMSGYWFSQQRLNKIYNWNFDADDIDVGLSMNFNVSPKDELLFPSLAKLFNIKYSVGFDLANALSVESLSYHLSGPAWFSGPFTTVKDIKSGINLFQQNEMRSAAEIPWLHATDNKVFDILPSLPQSPICKSRKFVRHDITDKSFSGNFWVQPGPSCILTISMNYSERLRAYSSINNEELRVIPVYGALTGVLVGPDAAIITVRSETRVPHWIKVYSYLWALLGVLLSLFLFGQLSNLVRRNSY